MPRQSDLRFTFEIASGTTKGPAWNVISFELRESLSSCFNLSLELSSPDPAVDFGTVLDQPVLFTIWRGEQAVRYVHGYVSTLSQGQTGHRRTRYSATVEPLMARAGLRARWELYQLQSAPDIIKQVLQRSGLHDVEMVLTKAHLPREFCMQPGESDYQFVTRLASEEGLYFAHHYHANGSQLTFGDRLYVHGAIEGGPVTYVPNAGGDQVQPCLWDFKYTENVRTARQSQNDYTFKNPRYRQHHLAMGVNLTHQAGDYEMIDWPGRYKQDEAGIPFTETRLLSRRADAQIATIKGDDARLTPGMAFDLVEHPRESLNHGWRTVRMTHIGTQTTSQEEESAEATVGTHYHFEADIIPDRIEWKPPLIAKPRLDGPQVAYVVGPAGEEIFCDEFARVRVQFVWDNKGQNNEYSSCWVRVSQSWAGVGWGHMAIPRIGQEVGVSFWDGDCDQPFISHRLHPATNPPPYELPRFNTLSPIRSKEFKGNRANELRIDDTSQQISAALMSDHGATQLHLGYLTHPRPKGGEPRGEGFELRSDEHGAVRAAKGLLVSAYAQTQANGRQLDVTELLQLVEQLSQQAKSLLDVAQSHQAMPAEHASRDQLVQAVQSLGAGANDRNGESGAKPIVVTGAPAGVVTATPASLLHAAGANIESVAQQDQMLTASRCVHVTAGEGISAFAISGGIRHLANQGDVITQAQHGTVHTQASEDVRLEANKQFIASANDKAILQCGKSAIVLHADGKIELYGTDLIAHAKWNVDNPSSLSTAVQQWDTTAFDEQVRVVRRGHPLPNYRYAIVHSDGGRIEGVTDSDGWAPLQRGITSEGFEFHLLGPANDTPSSK